MVPLVYTGKAPHPYQSGHTGGQPWDVGKFAFDGNVVHRDGPMIVREGEVADFNERADQAVAWAREVAAELGYDQ